MSDPVHMLSERASGTEAESNHGWFSVFNIVLRLAARAAGVSLLLLCAAPAPGRSDREALPESLVAAIPKHFPPQYIVKGDGSWTGFAIEVTEAVMKRAGIRLEYLPKEDWTQTMGALRNGQADLIPNIGITPEREQDFAFTRPMESFKISVFVRRDTFDVDRLEGLSSRKVAVVKDNAAQFLLAGRPELALDLVVYDRLSEAMLALLSGWVDALAYPEPTVWQTATEAGLKWRLKVIGQPLKEIKRAMAVRKDQQTLRDHLDQILGDFERTSEFRAIYMKWYGRFDHSWWEHPVLLNIGLLLGGLAIALLLHYLIIRRKNRQLQRELETNKRNTEAIRESEERYRGVVESLAEGVVIQSRDNDILIVNQSASQLLGVSPEYLQGTPLQDQHWHFLREDGSDLPPGAHPIQRTLDSGRPEHGVVLGLRNAKQDYRWLSINTQPLNLEGEEHPVAAVASYQDITKLKGSLEALSRQNQLLDALSQV